MRVNLGGGLAGKGLFGGSDGLSEGVLEWSNLSGGGSLMEGSLAGGDGGLVSRKGFPSCVFSPSCFSPCSCSNLSSSSSISWPSLIACRGYLAMRYAVGVKNVLAWYVVTVRQRRWYIQVNRKSSVGRGVQTRGKEGGRDGGLRGNSMAQGWGGRLDAAAGSHREHGPRPHRGSRCGCGWSAAGWCVHGRRGLSSRQRSSRTDGQRWCGSGGSTRRSNS